MITDKEEGRAHAEAVVFKATAWGRERSHGGEILCIIIVLR